MEEIQVVVIYYFHNSEKLPWVNDSSESRWVVATTVNAKSV